MAVVAPEVIPNDDRATAAATINPWHVAQRQFDLAADRLISTPACAGCSASRAAS